MSKLSLTKKEQLRIRLSLLENSKFNISKENLDKTYENLKNEIVKDDEIKLFDKLYSLKSSYKEQLNEIISNLNLKNYENVIDLCDLTIDFLKPVLKIINEKNNVYFDLSNFIEFLLYKNISKNNEKVIPYPLSISDVFQYKAAALNELGRYKEALDTIKEALIFSPLNFGLFFEYTFALQKLDSIEELFNFTNIIMETAFMGWQVSQCFLNLAFYYEAKKERDISVALLTMAYQYDKTPYKQKDLLREMAIISKASGKTYNFLKIEDAFKLLDQYKVPVCPSEEIINAYENSKIILEKSENKLALAILLEAYLSIHYDEENENLYKNLIDNLNHN